MAKLQVGVIGTGIMGERHCRVYASMPDIELVGVHDIDCSRAAPIARRHGTHYFSVLADLLAQVDAVSIVTPTPSHLDLALAALDAGVHILIEKPMTQTPEQADALVQAAAQHELVVQVGHIERFNPTYAELHNVLADMRPIAITMRRLSPYMTSATDVDVISDLMIHDLDLALHLAGSWPEQIQAVGRTLHNRGCDHVVASLSFCDGPIMTLIASRITEQKVRGIEVIAADAFVEADLLTKSIAIHRRTIPEFLQGAVSVKYRQESLIERIMVPASEPLLLELQHFVAAVRKRSEPLVGVQHGRDAIRLAATIKEMVAPEQSAAAPLVFPIETQRLRAREAAV